MVPVHGRLAPERRVSTEVLPVSPLGCAEAAPAPATTATTVKATSIQAVRMPLRVAGRLEPHRMEPSASSREDLMAVVNCPCAVLLKASPTTSWWRTWRSTSRPTIRTWSGSTRGSRSWGWLRRAEIVLVESRVQSPCRVIGVLWSGSSALDANPLAGEANPNTGGRHGRTATLRLQRHRERCRRAGIARTEKAAARRDAAQEGRAGLPRRVRQAGHRGDPDLQGPSPAVRPRRGPTRHTPAHLNRWQGCASTRSL